MSKKHIELLEMIIKARLTKDEMQLFTDKVEEIIARRGA